MRLHKPKVVTSVLVTPSCKLADCHTVHTTHRAATVNILHGGAKIVVLDNVHLPDHFSLWIKGESESRHARSCGGMARSWT
ncbi:hypothetical protein J2X24_000641 [Asticcacaulis solisilvae]|nr:hypothetical protein [Asticcacaulis solisilvae]MDR6799138.1 hypothetical protein [Asticcacaulis sp. BE141]